jgi:hypothetical protein
MKVTFQTQIGDGIEVDVSGSYDKPDHSVGYSGAFEVESVFLEHDNVNIVSLLTDKQLDTLEWQGVDAAKYQEFDAKCEAAEARYQAQRDNQLEAR